MDHTINTGDHSRAIEVSGCRGDEPSSVLYALQLADKSKAEILHDIIFLEASVSKSWKVVEAVCLRRLGRYHTEIVHRVDQAAAESGSASLIASIMRHGHDGHFRAINHRKAFRSAIREGHADAAKLLMDWWPEVRSSLNVETAIVAAA